MLELQREQHHRQAVELDVRVLRPPQSSCVSGSVPMKFFGPEADVLAQARGEDGKFRCHAVFIYRLVFRHSLNRKFMQNAASCNLDFAPLRLQSTMSQLQQTCQMATPSTALSLRAKLRKRWLLLWPITAALCFYPINNGLLRVTLLLLGVTLIGGLLGFYWHYKRLRVAILAVSCLGSSFLHGEITQPFETSAEVLGSLRKL